MEQLAPVGPIYQAGTLSGNPLAMAAGLEMLKTLKNNPAIYTELERKAAKLEAGLMENLIQSGTKGTINRVGSLLTLFFTKNEKVETFDEVMTSDKDQYGKYFRLALEAGIYLAPSQFEAAFISNAHSDEDIEKTIAASLEAMMKI
jgi:glutamate-1-semialdehyde 2,1-aminomutase